MNHQTTLGKKLKDSRELYCLTNAQEIIKATEQFEECKTDKNRELYRFWIQEADSASNWAEAILKPIEGLPYTFQQDCVDRAIQIRL